MRIAVESVRPRRPCRVPIVRAAPYLRSFVYLKFQQILPESGPARKRHATTYSRSIAEVRRVASRRVASRRIASRRIASRRIASRRIASRCFAHGQFHYSYWGVHARASTPLEAARPTVACARRNYAIKWCPDGRQLGAPWYSPFSSCHSESICIVMAPRPAPRASPPFAYKYRRGPSSPLLSPPLLSSPLLYVVRLKRTPYIFSCR